jgi:CSLREA domain-containing protein
MMQMMPRTAIHPLKIVAALGVAFLVWGLVLAYASSPAWAAEITVNTTADELNADGDCSLREAIAAANTDAAVDACAKGSGADTINVPSGTYPLSSQLTYGSDRSEYAVHNHS